MAKPPAERSGLVMYNYFTHSDAKASEGGQSRKVSVSEALHPTSQTSMWIGPISFPTPRRSR